jgi:hypothetical protein
MGTEPNSLVARLYFDEDVDARLAEALRQRGYDVQTAVATGLLGASDDEQLACAAGQQRALVTHNVAHFPGIHATWVESGQQHGGIVILIGHSAIGAWLRRMETLLDLFSGEELQNQLLFLGAEYDSLA